jgi:acetyltransferase-like isoleucine patch superfamily enzyme
MLNGVRKGFYTWSHGVAYYVKGYMIGGIKARLSGIESFGSQPRIFGKVKFKPDGRLIIGDRFVASGVNSRVSLLASPGATLRIGNDVAINHGTEIEAWHDVSIGDNTMLAPHVSILDHDRHEVRPGAPMYHGPVVIGKNVWLCRNVCVMPGVTIGDGSVIGANSVVTKDIPAGVFAAGLPAKVIKQLDLPDGWVRHGLARPVNTSAEAAAAASAAATVAAAAPAQSLSPSV